MAKTRLRGATALPYALVVGLAALGAALAVTQTGEQVSGLTAGVAGTVNAVDGALSGNRGPVYRGPGLADLTVPEYDAIGPITARGFLDPEGDDLTYSLSLTGGLLADDFTAQPHSDGLVIDGTPTASGTLAVVATDPIGRQAMAGPITVTVDPNQAPVFTDAGASLPAVEANSSIGSIALGDIVDLDADAPLNVTITDAGSGQAANFSVTGTQPARLSGTPDMQGTLELSVTWADEHGLATTAGPWTLVVSPDDTSCKTLTDTGGGTTNGVYQIDPENDGTRYSAYCDMTSNGGGWTMVVAGFEDDPMSSWSEGWQGDYDPTLTSRKSFALPQSAIPAHTQVGFGHQFVATLTGATTVADPFRYTTGDIPKTTVTGIDGNSWHIHRDFDGYYAWQNPDEPILNSPGETYWQDTLTFDRTGMRGLNWAYTRKFVHPTLGDLLGVGYALNGMDLHRSSEVNAWTVWVR